jgi:DNA-binding transcriptional ArsR family regulator
MTDDRCELLCLDLRVAERLRKKRLAPEAADAAAGKARALSDPTRLMLAAALLEANELCVCDLAWIAERSQTLVSHHVRALRSHGIVRSRREGKMVMYSLTEEGHALLASVLPAMRPQRRKRVHA